MHVPDGFMATPMCAATGAVAVVGVALAHRNARRALVSDGVSMAGLVTAFVFAAQMLNFPVAGGTSGHLMGGALAAVLLGPSAAIVCVSTVLVVQALLFADGGVEALGVNVVVMALVGVLVAWAVHRSLLRVLPDSSGGAGVAAAVGAFCSTVASAVVLSLLFAVGGRVSIDPTDLLVSMVGWHALIGLGEAVITGVVVVTVLASRRAFRAPGSRSSAQVPA